MRDEADSLLFYVERMNMKRTIYVVLFCLCWLAGMAQSDELIRVYTDKDCYLAGEELWVRISLNDDALPGNAMSRVAYIEIADTAQVRAQGKIALHQGVGWACLRLPQTMHTGTYQLTAYTRYMRNLEVSCFPRMYVTVLNTLGTSEDDARIVDDSLAFARIMLPESHALKGDKRMYGLREKVTLNWSSRLKEAKELVVSVVRKDCEVSLPQPEVTSPVQTEKEHWVAECEGHIVTGQVEGTQLPEALSAQLSCVGKDMNVFEGMKKGEGIYQFFTYGVTGHRDVVLNARNSNGSLKYRMQILSPFVELLPKKLPTLYGRYQDSAMVVRSVALQLARTMPQTTQPVEADYAIFHQLPGKTYNLDEYVRFETVRECIIEFVQGVAITKEGKREVIRLLQEDRRAYSMFPILVMIDGVAFPEHTDVLDYNARQLHYIHQYRGNYVLGNKIYGGILSLVTHRGTLPDMRINSDMRMFSYEFPQERPAFRMPDYEKETNRASRWPDFRHTLYWNPSAEGKDGVDFYTSDWEGTYEATVQGVASDGSLIEERWTFEVR